MNPQQAASAIAPSVSALGGTFHTDGATFERGAELGLPPGFQYYGVGRFGVLGRVDADVVVAAAVFMEPTLVRSTWEEALETVDPADGAEHYAETCRRWGRQHLAGVEGLERLAELAERVSAGASPVGASLFAGWRALPLPEDPPGRVSQLMMVLRELRFGRHAVAVLAAGLSPLESVLASRGGERTAGMFGWPEPYPDVTRVEGRRAAADLRTDELSAEDFAVLDADERAEIVELARRAAAAL